MGRRLIAIAGIALAAACGPLEAPAQQPAPVYDLGPPSEMPAPPTIPMTGTELPPGFDAGDGYPLTTEPIERTPMAETPGLAPAPDEMPPPEAFGAPGMVPEGRAPPFDPDVERIAAPTSTADSTVSPFILTPDQLRTGKQAVGVSVEVQAPSVVNLHQEATLKVLVRNNGTSPVMGVDVYYQVPEGMEYIDSQPAATDTKVHLVWKLETLAAGAERVLSVRVRPIEVGEFSHAATVLLRAGSKAQTHVQEPKLKVVQAVRRRDVLKGGQAQFDITVSNPGSGPARNVLVQAKLSSGLRHEDLRHEKSDFVEQVLTVVEPGHPVELDALVVEAIAGGEQTCTVTVSSPDVPNESPDGSDRSTVAMSVIEPRLDLKLVGPAQRYTDTVADYRITVHNPGTAPAQGVGVWAMTPIGGEPQPDMTDASHERQYDPARRLFYWNIPQLNPDERVDLAFSVRLGGLQYYKVTAQAQAKRPLDLKQNAEFSTNVTGLADVKIDVDERRKILDIGAETSYEIRLRNVGSKDATGLRVSAELSKQLRVVTTSTGQEGEAKSRIRPEDQVQELLFPEIERLAKNGELVLRINVEAHEAGTGSCNILLTHDDIGSTQLSQTAITHVSKPAEAAIR